MTVFEGELITQLVEHYNARVLSPMIKWRRNVGILLENRPYEWYDYTEFMNGKSPFMASKFSIEMPYMCYAYVDHIEVDIADYSRWDEPDPEAESKSVAYMSMGYDFIVKKFKKVVDKKLTCGAPALTGGAPALTCTKTKTLSLKCKEPNKPGYYASVSFGAFNYCTTITAIRVYGRAISLI